MLSAGSKLGPYEIQAPLGAGGMGEVYRARDARLGREVALKVLPEAFAKDAERLARFRREAQVLASLNHPNIAAIYGFEDSGGVHALVMELVEGPTLAERVKQRAISAEEALPIAKQICEALEYAHERGIIHRDLKPANIKIAQNDSVKVLDFGLAKALESDAAAVDVSSSPTISRMTQAGIILGTAAYMSPEQAKGKTVDRRTDIWAFGCVLYELLTGTTAFSGETVTDTLASVIRAEPDWSLLPASTPTHVRVLLQRCLQKDAKQRLRDIGDARIAIDEVLSGAAAAAERQSFAVKTPEHAGRRWLPWGIAGSLAIVVVIGAVAYFRSNAGPPVAPGITSLSVSLPQGVSLVLRDALPLALSPDGRSLVFMGEKDGAEQLYLRTMDQPDSGPIQGTEGGVSPFLSPDGQWIGFFASGQLKKVSIHGGEPVTLADAPNQRGGSWAPDGSIIFSPDYSSGLMRIPAGGGPVETLLAPDAGKGERSYRWPEALPNGKGILYTVGKAAGVANYEGADIAIYSFQARQSHIVTHGWLARYSSAGYLLSFRTGLLTALPFDENRMQVTGPAIQLTQTVGGDVGSAAVYFSMAANAAMVYVQGSTASQMSTLVLVTQKGDAHTLPLPPRQYNNPRFSPDGKRLVFAIGNVTGPADIWTYDLKTGNLSRLTFDNASILPVWSPNGSRIAFDSLYVHQGITTKAADGSGGEQELFIPGMEGVQPDAWSANGKIFAFTVDKGANGDLWTVDLEAKTQPTLFQANASGAVFSPDGKFVAYTSYQSGTYQVLVREFPSGGQWQIGNEGGADPKWSRDGRELFYASTPAAYVHNWTIDEMNVQTEPSFHFSSPHALFQFSFSKYTVATTPQVNYDVSPDGQQFVFIQPGGQTQAPSEINVVLNFPAEIRAPMQK